MADAPKGAASPAPVVRHAASVVLIDPSNRVLLFASKDDGEGILWYTPGSRREPGETARRELREETGRADKSSGAELWRGRGPASWAV